MSREVESITINYMDETGKPAKLTVPCAEGLDVGAAVNRLTNGAVTQDSHVIANNGVPCGDSKELSDGDRITASPRKTVSAG